MTETKHQLLPLSYSFPVPEGYVLVSTSYTVPAMPVRHQKKDPATGKYKPDMTREPRLVIDGYYTSGKTPNWGRLKRYHAWKDWVLRHTPAEIRALKSANKPEEAVRMNVECFFQNRVHNDIENASKGVVDTLFPKGDKWVAGYHGFPNYDPDNPRVEITVHWLQKQEPDA